MPGRRLVVIRHAKSDWPDGVPDHRRPLAARGRREAPLVGAWLAEHVGTLDAVACSPAQRARETWDLVAAALPAAPAAAVDERVYAATAGELLAVVRDLPAEAATAALVGHNPGLEDLVALLTGEHRILKTSAVAVLTWDGAWAAATPRTAVLAAHVTVRG